jgi:pilus assembly protein TadC
MNTSEKDLKNPESEVREHIMKCVDCRNRIEFLKQSEQFINDQKEEVLSEKKTNEIIRQLLERTSDNKSVRLNGKIFISRIAAVLIISFGLLAGVLAGRFLINNNEGQNVWGQEFSLLSDNSDYTLFE